MNIKDIKYQIVEQTLQSGRIKYVIGVEYKSKGMLWGWNERAFILESYRIEYTKTGSGRIFDFVDNLDTFDDAWDRQNTSYAFRTRFVTLDTIEECNDVIEQFKTHCERELQNKKNSTVISIKAI